MRDNDASSKTLWFVGGAAVGVAIAFLYAPMAGKDARKKLASQSLPGRNAFAGSGRDMIEKGRELYDRGRQIVDEAAEMFERGRKLMEDAPRETL